MPSRRCIRLSRLTICLNVVPRLTSCRTAAATTLPPWRTARCVAGFSPDGSCGTHASPAMTFARVLDREGITFALWGARRPEQLGAVAEIAGWKIDASAMREIDRIVASCVKQPVGPEFMAPPDRLAA